MPKDINESCFGIFSVVASYSKSVHTFISVAKDKGEISEIMSIFGRYC